MSRITRTLLTLALSAGLLAAPALASEASDAWKQGNELKTAIRKAADENARAEAQRAFEEFCRKKVEVLSVSKGTLPKMDLMYLGLLQAWAGDKDAAIETLRAAVDKKEETQYGANIHANLVQALIDAGQVDGAAAETEKMQVLYTEAKETKTCIMNVGMAYRGKLEFEKSAKWLATAFDKGTTTAAKPLVNSLLMAGKKDEAVKAAQNAIDKGIPQQKADMQVMKDVTEKIDTDVSDLVQFDGFVPSGKPDLTDKVLVLGFWNVSSKSFKWTLKVLDNVKKMYGEDVVCIAATTYYKKNAETGKIEESMSPEVERDFGAKLADQEEWRGWMGYMKDEATLKALGLSALPHFVVITKDRKLAFAHTMDYSGGGETDIKVLRKALDSVTGR